MADETGRRIIVNNEGRRVKGAPSFFYKNRPNFLGAFQTRSKAFSDSVFQ